MGSDDDSQIREDDSDGSRFRCVEPVGHQLETVLAASFADLIVHSADANMEAKGVAENSECEESYVKGYIGRNDSSTQTTVTRISLEGEAI